MEKLYQRVNGVRQSPPLTGFMLNFHTERVGSLPAVMQDTFVQHVAQQRRWFPGSPS